MKKITILLILLITLALSSVSFAAGPMGDPAKDPGGFRGFPWGTSLEEVSSKEDLHFVGTTNPTNEIEAQVYLVQTDDGNILYAFIDDALFSGTLEFFPDEENKETLIRVSIDMYGEPNDEKDGVLFWNFEKTRIAINPSILRLAILYNDARVMRELFGK